MSALPEVNWESWPVADLAAFLIESMIGGMTSRSLLGEVYVGSCSKK